LKQLLFGTTLLALVTVVSVPAMAQVAINVNIPLPPPIVFNAPPNVVAMPDTNDVYAAPDINADLFFWNGWWWRLWDGRWYRSPYYDRGWGYYNRVPSFYFDVDPGWRGFYRNHNWRGRPWNYERIPQQQLQQSWKSWHANHYWAKEKTWDVQSYQPRPQQQRQVLRQQRQQQYQQRPEVQRQQQQRQQPQGRVQQPQRPQAQQQHAQPREKREGGEEEHRK
jgi:hypothetical protein